MTKVAKGPAPGTGATVGYSNPVSLLKHALEGAAEEDLITLTLDGREVKARKGETIMEVAHREDVYIPHYCWHPALSIAGNCRLCLVEVEKVPKPVIGCQTTVTPGMVVRTNSEVAKDAQKWMMEFLLVNHPLDCPICDRGGECQLQRYSMEYGTGHTRMLDKKRKFIKPQADPLIDIERNRCIMCTRCVRFCDEVGGEHVMGVFDRGEGNYIGTFGQGPVSNIFSGNVIDLCPVGCLTSKPFRFRARPWELTQTQSTCDMCSSGCKVTSWTRNGKLYRTTPPSRRRHDHFTINEDTEEFICNQGRFAGDYGQHESRVTESLARRGDRLQSISFVEAIREAGERLKAVAREHGPESVAVLVSPRATLEEGFLARQLTDTVLRTPSIDWRSSFASRAAADAVSAALRVAGGDLEHNPDVILVINGKLEWASPVLALRLQELARRYGKKVVMLGHYHDSYIAAHSDHRHHNQPGRTADVLHALAKAVRSEAQDLGDLAQRLNLTPEDAKHLVYALMSAKRGLVVQGLEDFRGVYAPAEVPAALDACGALGDGWSYLPVVRDRNAVGLNALGVEPGEQGVAALDLAEAIDAGRIKALIAIGADALAALPKQQAVREALGKLDAFILADPFESEFSDAATIFLASATNLERDGVYADIEGNVALLQRAAPAPGNNHAWWQILVGLGRAMGTEEFGAPDIDHVWQQVRAKLAPQSRVTLAELELEGSTPDSKLVMIKDEGGARNRASEYNPGNNRKDGLHLRRVASDRPARPDAAVAPQGPPAGEGFVLVWGPHVSAHGYLNDRASIATILLPKPFVEMHPADAAELGVVDDQFAVLECEGVRAKVAVRTSRGPARGTLWMPEGAYGAFDAAATAGPVRVQLKPMDEMAPNQGGVLVGTDTTMETH